MPGKQNECHNLVGGQLESKTKILINYKNKTPSHMNSTFSTSISPFDIQSHLVNILIRAQSKK